MENTNVKINEKYIEGVEWSKHVCRKEKNSWRKKRKKFQVKKKEK